MALHEIFQEFFSQTPKIEGEFMYEGEGENGEGVGAVRVNADSRCVCQYTHRRLSIQIESPSTVASVCERCVEAIGAQVLSSVKGSRDCLSYHSSICNICRRQ